ncbi:MAG: hypothetical protein ABR923_13715 [Terracidiphilus sp.]
MNSKRKTQFSVSGLRAAATVLLVAASFTAIHAGAQAASRFLGTISAISGDTLTVKTDAGDVHQVQVPSSAVLKRIEPGQKDLTTAVDMKFSDLATGDRVLVKLDPAAPAGVSQAMQIIAIKAADVATKQQQDREDWQKRGVGGLVKSVDPAAGVIVLTSGVGATAKTITVNTTKSTVLKRYAPASVNFDQAKVAPIDEVHAGDQLRARGTKNADGTQIAAEEVVSGTFRNVSGMITSIDPSTSTLVVKDLATKKQVTIHITPDAQMKRLPDTMAQMLAARLKGGSSGGGSAPRAQYTGQRAGGQGGDSQQMLNRLPAIQLADLKKGEAVMLVSTDGANEVTAITLLAGVEPLLEAPAASQNLLNNWSMGSGAPDTGVQ